MIVPGFVNCHSHLEYAVYAGFGDGLPFPDWIALHVARKGLLDPDDMVAIATDGAHECLRSGITTVGDCSFAGAAAEAASEPGLRAIVYLEVFSLDGSALERFDRLREQVEPLALGARPSSASRRMRRTRARWSCTSSAPRSGFRRRRTSPRASPSASSSSTGSGDWSAFGEMLVPPPGITGIRMLADAGLLGPHAHGRALRRRRRRGDRAARAAPSRRRALPSLERDPRLRRRAARRAARRGDRRRHRDRQPRVDAVVRPVRGAPDGDRRGPCPRARGPTRSRRATRSSSRRSAARACSGWTARSARSSPESRPTSRSSSLDEQPVRAC